MANHVRSDAGRKPQPRKSVYSRYARLDVMIEVRNDSDDKLVSEVEVNLANDGARSRFVEQLANALEGQQYVIISPIQVLKRL